MELQWMDTDWYTHEKAVAELRIGWLFDAWKLEMGMLDILPRGDSEEERYFDQRKSWRSSRSLVYGPQDEPYRFLPMFNGYCLLVRDKR